MIYIGDIWDYCRYINNRKFGKFKKFKRFNKFIGINSLTMPESGQNNGG